MNDNNTISERHWIGFRVKPEEYRQIHRHFSATTCRKLSEYARKVLLNRPVTVKFRNQSADEFLSSMLPLKNELNAIGNNFNQAVKKLHSLDRISEFKQKIHNGCLQQLTISAIAMECGFSSQATFQRIFKQSQGMTPSEYLKTARPAS